jgi:hypothetical protein
MTDITGFQKILAQLKPLEDRAFTLPCTAEEIIDLQAALVRPLPQSYTFLLQHIGLLQDLFNGTARTIAGMKLSAERFKKALGSADYFPFADVEDETVLLLHHAPDDEQVYRLNPDERDITPANQTLPDFINACIQEARANPDMPTNDKKFWAVQFTIKAPDDSRILPILQSTLGIEATASSWKYLKTSPAQVKSFARDLKLQDQTLTLKKQEYIGWQAPNFYLDWSEPVLQLRTISNIRKLDSAFVTSGLDYVLVDYGILT